MKQLSKWILGILAFSILSPASADTNSIFISLGPDFSRLNNDEYVSINNMVVNEYKSNNATNSKFIWGAGIAHTFNNIYCTPISISLGLADYFIDYGHVSGIKYPLVNDGIYDSLNYKFEAKSNALMLESRFYYDYKSWQPFILVGAGNAWNKLSDYSEVPTNPSLSAAPGTVLYGSHTETSFAYELGLGIQHDLFNCVKKRVLFSGSLDYRYINTGKGRLNNFPAITTNDHLKINNLNTQALMFSITAALY